MWSPLLACRFCDLRAAEMQCSAPATRPAPFLLSHTATLLCVQEVMPDMNMPFYGDLAEVLDGADGADALLNDILRS